MTCRHFGDAIVCDGRAGGWRVTQASCPWCCLQGRQTRCLFVWIFGGYGGMDFVCGECGQRWSNDGEILLRKFNADEEDEKRAEGIALVASVPDPKCWRCHDTGDEGIPGFDMPGANPCDHREV